MATVKKNTKIEVGNADTLWRQPITLDSFEDDDDPLATLYRGREVGDSKGDAENTVRVESEKPVESADESVKKSIKPATTATKPTKQAVKKTPQESKIESEGAEGRTENARSPKISEADLKNLLKIKSDSFQFTDIREILRGKSYDIYAYLRFLSGDAGVCKIKHLDLMRELDISRPTLFKQGDWLTRLSLIEKRNVPGDHLGTSYTIHRVEDVLPVSDTLVEQLESHIENFKRTSD